MSLLLSTLELLFKSSKVNVSWSWRKRINETDRSPNKTYIVFVQKAYLQTIQILYASRQRFAHFGFAIQFVLSYGIVVVYFKNILLAHLFLTFFNLLGTGSWSKKFQSLGILTCLLDNWAWFCWFASDSASWKGWSLTLSKWDMSNTKSIGSQNAWTGFEPDCTIDGTFNVGRRSNSTRKEDHCFGYQLGQIRIACWFACQRTQLARMLSLPFSARIWLAVSGWREGFSPAPIQLREIWNNSP